LSSSLDGFFGAIAEGFLSVVLRGLYTGIGLSHGGGRSGARKIVDLIASLAGKGIDIRGLIARVSPIRFIPPHGGNPADVHEATIVPDICAVLIDKEFPQWGGNYMLPFPDDYKPPAGEAAN
jgi:hypothetical protein